MKIIYEQDYISKFDITIIMKAIYNEKENLLSYKLSGYYFGKPNLEDLEIFKEKRN